MLICDLRFDFTGLGVRNQFGRRLWGPQHERT